MRARTEKVMPDTGAYIEQVEKARDELLAALRCRPLTARERIWTNHVHETVENVIGSIIDRETGGPNALEPTSAG